MHPLVARLTLAAALAALAALAACTSLPPPAARTPSTFIADTQDTQDTQDTTIARSVALQGRGHEGLTGTRALVDSLESFATRLALVGRAERSIDIQTYIWRDDTSGVLLARALREAADRGVRVRLLLDDANTAHMDDFLMALDDHPGIEVRLFNPFRDRVFRLWDIAGDFARINRRMHNKAFTVDGQVTVVGGRNIGDEYFGARSAVAFLDLDVVAAGPVARDVSADFDAYWNSESAWPAAWLLHPLTDVERAQLLDQWERRGAAPEAAEYREALHRVDLVEQMRAGKLSLDWVPVRLVSDAPDKVRDTRREAAQRFAPQLEAALGRPQQDLVLVLVSPYFVPGRAGTAAIAAIAARGVRVHVLTNSLDATDVAATFLGYAPYRAALLRAGVNLFELKPALTEADTPRVRAGLLGSSAASLHAKTFAVDRSRVFVGSFNLDPRSDRLNTEMRLVIESPALAGAITRAFDDFVPRNAYEVRLVEGALEWVERKRDTEVVHHTPPAEAALRRLWLGILSLLPLEALL